MIKHIAEPAAFAVVTWLAPEQGGRSSGPPTAQVYAATCIFPLGDDREVYSEWPKGAEQFSILLEEIDRLPDGNRVCKVGFLAPDLVQPFVKPGADVLVMEGPKIVASAVIREVVAS
jgi:hypothetical protein